MIRKNLADRYSLLLLLLIAFLSVKRITKEEEVYPTGDAVEYTLQTEAFYNHFSSDVRYSDYESFKSLYLRSKTWDKNPRGLFYDEMAKFIQSDTLKKFDYHVGFFSDGQKRIYSCHFFAYALTALPLRVVCAIFPFDPLRIHQYTNVLILLITCFFLLRFSVFPKMETAGFVVAFFFSTNYWYLSWQHPEVFTTCMAALGMWLFLGETKRTGILLVAVASLQNQPLSLVVLVMALISITAERLTFKNMIRTGLCSVPVLLPAIYYYLHFGTFNLISHTGSMISALATGNRVSGFFFDLNQGMILAIPFVLLLYIVLLLVRLGRFRDYTWDLLLPLGIIGAVYSASMIDNWNHGQAVVNRYVTYMSAVVMVHCFYLLMRLKKPKLKWSLLSLVWLTQIATVLYHQPLAKYDWSGNDPKPISNWVLEHHPKWYNPDPTIFIARYGMRVAADLSKSPAYFMKPDGTITKFLVHREWMKNLKNFGYTDAQIEAVSGRLKFVNDWAYINVDENFESSMSPAELRKMDDDRRMAETIENMKSHPDWFDLIKTKAKQTGLPVEEVLRRDAAYVNGIKIEINETREEKIVWKIQEINSNPEWKSAIMEKAKEQNISLDSAIRNDATFMVDQELLNRK